MTLEKGTLEPTDYDAEDEENSVLQAFAFGRLGVVVGDLYFLDPDPDPGQDGPEHGVRLEVRLMERPPHDGSIYAARPVVVGRPIWRLDLLESVDGPVGSFDRTHHHPGLQGWEPGVRTFDRELTARPFEWLEERLCDVPGLLAQAGLPAGTVDEDEVGQVRRTAPEIVDATRRMLDRVRRGELALPPDGPGSSLVRTGWL